MTLIRSDRGFTLIELLVAMGIVGIALVTAVPSLSSMHAQMRSSHDARLIAASVSQWRSEAIRLRRSVDVTFVAPVGATPGSVSADFDGDGDPEETIQLSRASDWSPLMPADFAITGLGIIPSLPAEGVEVEIANRDQSTQLTIFPTGIISLVQG
ncbi:MAG: prepilin-type N-terminal cleavage/methylation domain-containing protein [Deltaproteobacteria bacterium]|nr:prepilin-type N-terminal cleavage/methylation domain-containing protein [Deltaproteobacteria bacterium]